MFLYLMLQPILLSFTRSMVNTGVFYLILTLQSQLIKLKLKTDTSRQILSIFSKQDLFHQWPMTRVALYSLIGNLTLSTGLATVRRCSSRFWPAMKVWHLKRSIKNRAQMILPTGIPHQKVPVGELRVLKTL